MSSIPSSSGSCKQGTLDPQTMRKCRICFFAKGTIQIFSLLPGYKVTIATAILKTFNFNLNSQLHFPKNICKCCLQYLISAYALKSKLINTEVLLRDLADQNSSKAPNTFTSESGEVFVIDDLDGDEEVVEESQGQSEEDQEESIPDNESTSKDDVIEIDDDSDDEEADEPPKTLKRKAPPKSKTKGKFKKFSSRFPSNKCSNCPFLAVTEEDLINHLETSAENCLDAYRKIECSICLKRFATKDRKASHLTQDHTNVDFRFCKYCGKKDFHNMFHFERHRAMHLKNPADLNKRQFGIANF